MVFISGAGDLLDMKREKYLGGKSGCSGGTYYDHDPESAVDEKSSSYWCTENEVPGNEKVRWYYVFHEEKKIDQVRISFNYCNAIKSISILATDADADAVTLIDHDQAQKGCIRIYSIAAEDVVPRRTYVIAIEMAERQYAGIAEVNFYQHSSQPQVAF